jgi:hypothetical protein
MLNAGTIVATPETVNQAGILCRFPPSKTTLLVFIHAIPVGFAAEIFFCERIR